MCGAARIDTEILVELARCLVADFEQWLDEDIACMIRGGKEGAIVKLAFAVTGMRNYPWTAYPVPLQIGPAILPLATVKTENSSGADTLIRAARLAALLPFAARGTTTIG